uniref:Uncharacterized protein n=1 Tax=Ananas comosus var. bracteatus TaxID=296719 RepID=A0A6V7PGX7_ANACO|nr:unnamed protein product [Ananas comosus var. bracteatus]
MLRGCGRALRVLRERGLAAARGCGPAGSGTSGVGERRRLGEGAARASRRGHLVSGRPRRGCGPRERAGRLARANGREQGQAGERCWAPAGGREPARAIAARKGDPSWRERADGGLEDLSVRVSELLNLLFLDALRCRGKASPYASPLLHDPVVDFLAVEDSGTAPPELIETLHQSVSSAPSTKVGNEAPTGGLCTGGATKTSSWGVAAGAASEELGTGDGALGATSTTGAGGVGAESPWKLPPAAIVGPPDASSAPPVGAPPRSAVGRLRLLSDQISEGRKLAPQLTDLAGSGGSGGLDLLEVCRIVRPGRFGASNRIGQQIAAIVPEGYLTTPAPYKYLIYVPFELFSPILHRDPLSCILISPNYSICIKVPQLQDFKVQILQFPSDDFQYFGSGILDLRHLLHYYSLDLRPSSPDLGVISAHECHSGGGLCGFALMSFVQVGLALHGPFKSSPSTAAVADLDHGKGVAS